MRSITRKLLSVGILIAGRELTSEKPLYAYSCATEYGICNKENGYICSQEWVPIFNIAFICCDKTTDEISWGGICNT